MQNDAVIEALRVLVEQTHKRMRRLEDHAAGLESVIEDLQKGDVPAHLIRERILKILIESGALGVYDERDE